MEKINYRLMELADEQRQRDRTLPNNGESQTMPNAGKSISYYLNRVKRGLPLPNQRQINSTGLENLDLVDQIELGDKASAFLLDLKGTIDTEREAQQSIKQLELVNSLVEEGLKARVGEGSNNK
jgi:hypothetical protein